MAVAPPGRRCASFRGDLLTPPRPRIRLHVGASSASRLVGRFFGQRRDLAELRVLLQRWRFEEPPAPETPAILERQRPYVRVGPDAYRRGRCMKRCRRG